MSLTGRPKFVGSLTVPPTLQIRKGYVVFRMEPCGLVPVDTSYAPPKSHSCFTMLGILVAVANGTEYLVTLRPLSSPCKGAVA